MKTPNQLNNNPPPPPPRPPPTSIAQSADRLQSLQCPFEPQFATTSRTGRGGSPSNNPPAAVAVRKTPAEKQQAASGRSSGNRRANAAAIAAGEAGPGTGGTERLSMPWDETMRPAAPAAAAAAPAMPATAIPAKKRGGPAPPAGKEVSPQKTSTAAESTAATPGKEASSSTGGVGPVECNDGVRR